MSKIEKWVCGKNLKGEYVVKSVLVRETKAAFIVAVKDIDPQVAWLLNYRTHLSKVESPVFDTAEAAIQAAITKETREVTILEAKIVTCKLHLTKLRSLLEANAKIDTCKQHLTNLLSRLETE